MSLLTKNRVLARLLNEHLAQLAVQEGLDALFIENSIQQGRMVLLAGSRHADVCPVLVGQPARVKVNANIGTSFASTQVDCELEKLAFSLELGADTITDLSLEGDLEAIRMVVLNNSSVPVGSSPLYGVARRCLNQGKSPSGFDLEELFREIEDQAMQGVDFMIIPCGVTPRAGARGTSGAPSAEAIVARWMEANGRENPFMAGFERILNIACAANITLVLDGGLRFSAQSAANGATSWQEAARLGALAQKARAAGVQCMIKGPAYARLNEVEKLVGMIKKMTYSVPLYMTGPLVTYSAPGYDHIASAIGGALAISAGADFLCCADRAEGLFPSGPQEVRAQVAAARIAVRAGETACSRPHALLGENELAIARENADWLAMGEKTLDRKLLEDLRLGVEEKNKAHDCASCQQFCALRTPE